MNPYKPPRAIPQVPQKSFADKLLITIVISAGIGCVVAGMLYLLVMLVGPYEPVF